MAPTTDLPSAPARGAVNDRQSASLVGQVRAELAAAGRESTALGRQALTLAARVESPFESGSAVASLSRELRAVMADALEGVGMKADPLEGIRGASGRKLRLVSG